MVGVDVGPPAKSRSSSGLAYEYDQNGVAGLGVQASHGIDVFLITDGVQQLALRHHATESDAYPLTPTDGIVVVDTLVIPPDFVSDTIGVGAAQRGQSSAVAAFRTAVANTSTANLNVNCIVRPFQGSDPLFNKLLASVSFRGLGKSVDFGCQRFH